MARELTASQFCARLSQEERQQVQQALSDGMGVARFGSWLLTFGSRDAVITTRFPPSRYGEAELGDFVSATSSAASMRSPLLDAVGGPPQIARPRVSPSVTEYPDVQLQLRTSSHPRGNNKNGFIDVQPLLPGRPEPEPVEPQQLTEDQAWWGQRFTSRQ